MHNCTLQSRPNLEVYTDLVTAQCQVLGSFIQGSWWEQAAEILELTLREEIQICSNTSLDHQDKKMCASLSGR
jgi:hypothetical protein